MKWHAYLSFYRHLIQLFECKLARKREKEREREHSKKCKLIINQTMND